MWECAAGESDDCDESGMFDAAWRDEDGAPICYACADELGLKDYDP